MVIKEFNFSRNNEKLSIHFNNKDMIGQINSAKYQNLPIGKTLHKQENVQKNSKTCF